MKNKTLNIHVFTALPVQLVLTIYTLAKYICELLRGRTPIDRDL